MSAAHALPADAADFNLRDFGGYGTRSGARIRTGLLYRAAELDRAGPGYHALLTQLGADHVVDFRGDAERESDRGPAFNGFAGTVLTADVEDDTIPHALGALFNAAGAGAVAAQMMSVYAALPFSPRFRQALGLWFQALDRGNGASLVHCFAGKDRTGLAVALLQLMLGVNRDDVFHEYLLTNAMGAGRLAAGIAGLRRQASAALDDSMLHEMMLVRPDYLATALAEIRQAATDPARYVRSVSGLDDRALARLEARLLA